MRCVATALTFGVGIEKESVVHVGRRMVGGKFSFVKL